MKLKNLKKGTKDKNEQKVQKVKKQPQTAQSNLEEDQQRDDELVDIKEDLTKKNQTKAKVVKRVEGSKLQQVQYDTTKLLVQKKEQKKQRTTWVTSTQEALKKDFKMQQHQNDFESLTDNTINQKIKEKKEKEPAKTVEQVGGLKFAPIINEAKRKQDNSEPLILGKPKAVNTNPIITNSEPVKTFTNSNLQAKFTEIEKSPQQIREQEIERKMQEQKAKQPQIVPAKGKGGWLGAKKPVANEQPQKVEQFKPTVMNFTNSKKQQTVEGSFKFAALEKTPQQLKMQALQKSENQVFVSKKQQQERRKKRQQNQKGEIKKFPVKVDVNAMN